MNRSGEGTFTTLMPTAGYTQEQLEADARRNDPVTFEVLLKRLRLVQNDGSYIITLNYGPLIWAIRKSEEHTMEQFFAGAMGKFAEDFADLFPTKEV